MSGSPITDDKAPQWFRMQPILPLRGFFAPSPGRGLCFTGVA